MNGYAVCVSLLALMMSISAVENKPFNLFKLLSVYFKI